MAKKAKVRVRKATKAKTAGSRSGSAMSKVRAAYDAVIEGKGSVDDAKAAARKAGEKHGLQAHTVRAFTSRYSRGITGSGESAKAGKRGAKKARVRVAKKAAGKKARVRVAAKAAKRAPKKAARVRAERAEAGAEA
jgi:hypothetical protein